MVPASGSSCSSCPRKPLTFSHPGKAHVGLGLSLPSPHSPRNGGKHSSEAKSFPPAPIGKREAFLTLLQGCNCCYQDRKEKSTRSNLKKRAVRITHRLPDVSFSCWRTKRNQWIWYHICSHWATTLMEHTWRHHFEY